MQKYIKRGMILSTAVAAVAIQAQAATYTYTPASLAASTNAWNAAATWGNAGFPNAAGDIATVTADITGDHLLNLNQGVTIGTLNLGDANGSNSYTVATGTGTNTLSFDSGVVAAPAQLNIGNSGAATNNLNAALNLASSLTINMGGTQKLSTGSTATLAINSNALTIAGAGAGTTNVILNGDVTGGANATIVKTGLGGLEFGTNTKSFAGSIVANQGTSSNGGSINLIGGSLANAASITINGFLKSDVSQSGGSVLVGSNATWAVNPGQRLTTNTIALNGGTLADLGQGSTLTASLPTWTTPVTDNVNTLSFNSGYNQVTMGVGANSTGTVIAVTNLQRGAGATVLLKSVDLLGNSAGRYAKVTVGNIDTGNNGGSFQLGAGGAAGTTNRSIIPWIGTRYANANGANPEGFATYDAATGIRDLKSNEYLNTATFNASVAASPTYGNDNVFANNGNLTLAADRTINSLTMSYAGGNLGAGRTLTIKSGGVFFANGGRDLGSGASGGTAAAGTVAFGAAEGVIWVQGGTGSTINNIGAAITGSGGLSVNGGPGTSKLVLTGSNNYSGQTTVSAGTLQVGGLFTVNSVPNTLVSSNLGSGNVEVANGALLTLMSSATIADTATVTLDQYGLSSIAGMNGKMSLATGVNETVGGLYFGIALQSAGTYGSSLSAATFKNDTYFDSANSGILVVVPEPGTASLLALTVGGMLMRRRRA